MVGTRRKLNKWKKDFETAEKRDNPYIYGLCPKCNKKGLTTHLIDGKSYTKCKYCDFRDTE